MNSQIASRNFYFLLFLGVSLFVFWIPLRMLIVFSLEHDYGSHILLVPLVSVYIMYLAKREVFSRVQFGLRAGSGLFLTGTVLCWLAHKHSPSFGQDDYFSLMILSIIIVWISGFIFCYGTQAFKVARFPLLFLFLMVPIPGFLLDRLVFLLQAGSAATAYGLLRLLGVPVFRQGFVLLLPGIDIEVAKQCSGIRSSLALLITTLVVGEFALRSVWRRSLLVVSTLPILIVKNGTRIATISLLGVYVDRGFLHGWLHTSGGILFYLLGLVILVPIIISLRKSEDSNRPVTAMKAAGLSSLEGQVR